MQKTLRQASPLFLILFLFVYAWNINRDNPKPILLVPEQDRQLNFNQKFIEAASMGQQRFLSSIMWIQTLMDSDLDHYKGKDLNSWMFLRFDAITALDPYFYEAYLWGGMYLSVVKDDVLGASVIYEKGLKKYPQDMELNFNAGFNDYFELGHTEKALKKFDTVLSTEKGVLSYRALVSLVEKIRNEAGVPYYTILKNLDSRYQKVKDPKIRQYIKNNMYAVKATADLKCLNDLQKTENQCQKTDLFNQPYLLKNNRWVSQTPFKEFRVYHRKDK